MGGRRIYPKASAKTLEKSRVITRMRLRVKEQPMVIASLAGPKRGKREQRNSKVKR
jgi:hypothetical protein